VDGTILRRIAVPAATLARTPPRLCHAAGMTPAITRRRGGFVLSCVINLGLGWPAAAPAQTDEIQVYDGGLAGPGVFNLRGGFSGVFQASFTPF
jgi:hypothetical protein